MIVIDTRWGPRGRPWPRVRPQGHILKSLASKPQVLENCLVVGLRTAVFFEWLKFCRSAEKNFFGPFFFLRSPKNLFEDLFLRSPEKKF